MRLWIDDERPMPEDFDHHVKTSTEAIEILKSNKVDFISFDHDLGPEHAGTGYHVAMWIEHTAFRNKIGRIGWKIHSANPVGRARIASAMESAERFWSLHCG